MNAAEYLDPPPAPTPLGVPPTRGRVLVVSPHEDDELIGSGGTLIHHRELGDEIRIVVLTDGTGGDFNREYDPETYRDLREQESREAARRLGASDICFLRFPDGARARREDLGAVVPSLLEIMDAYQPQVIYAPHKGEIHPDHYVTAVAVEQAVLEWGGAAKCWGYEIWAPLVADVVVDISAHMAEKQDICQVYKSQLKYADLTHYFTGMNGYRSLYLGPKARYGEAFQEFPAGSRKSTVP